MHRIAGPISIHIVRNLQQLYSKLLVKWVNNLWYFVEYMLESSA